MRGGAAAVAAVGLVVFAVVPAQADEIEQEEIIVGEEIVAPPPERCPECDVNNGMVSFAMGSDFTNAYFFRGILQERNGFIWQPWGEVTFTLWEAGQGSQSFLQDFSGTLGTWNSVHTKQTGSPGDGNGPGNWYESDLYGGFGIGMAEGIGMGVTYIAYTSPNNAFGTVQELDVDVSWDDSGLYGNEMSDLGFSINPYGLVAFELDKTAFGSDEGIYAEAGAEPTVELNRQSDYPVAFGVPLSGGFSIDNYYKPNDAVGDDTFGYFQVGVSASVGLGFIPVEYGSLSAGVSGHYLTLGSNLQDFNDGRSKQWIGVASLAWEY